MRYRTKILGGWTVQLSDERVTIGQAQVGDIERLINDGWLPIVRKDYLWRYYNNYALRAWNVPSILLYVDMPPFFEANEGRCLDFYEIDANPASYSIVCHAGLPLGMLVANGLKSLHIDSLCYGVMPSRMVQEDDLCEFMEVLAQHGIDTVRVDVTSAAFQKFLFLKDLKVPFWLRAGEEDTNNEYLRKVFPQCLLLHGDNGGNKNYLTKLAGAQMLSECIDLFAAFPYDDRDVRAVFPNGVAIKPVNGWGSHGVQLWCPHLPRITSTRTKIRRTLDYLRREGKIDTYLVQPFITPQHTDKGHYRMWRIYAMWTPSGYRVLGGYWIQRKGTTKLHGASDTISGPVEIAN